MIPGPSVHQMSGPTAQGVRIDAILGQEVLAINIPVIDGTTVIDGNSDRIVSQQLAFSAPLDWIPKDPRDPLNNYGQRLHVWSVLEIEGVPHEIELGWFQIEEWSEGKNSVQVKALDLMQVLEKDEAPWPSSPTKNATLLSEIRRLAGGMPVKLDCKDRPLPGTMQWGRSRTKAIKDLCESLGLGFGIKTDGYLHIWEEGTARISVASYHSDDLLIAAPRKSLPRRANVIMAVGEHTVEGPKDSKDKPAPIKYAATAETTLPPYSSSEYGIVREVIEVQSAQSEETVRRVAHRRLSEIMITGAKRSVEIVMDPRLELGDVIAVTPPKDAPEDAETPFSGRVVAFSKPLDNVKKLMRIDVEVLSW